jgi:predicted nucleotidyltransferase
MATTVILHIKNSEPVIAEVDELPKPNDLVITVKNPRSLDGKDLHYLMDKVVTVIWPIESLYFIEVMPSEEEEQIIGFVRE